LNQKSISNRKLQNFFGTKPPRAGRRTVTIASYRRIIVGAVVVVVVCRIIVVCRIVE